MGVELHITRAEFWADNDECHIAADEWLRYVASDPELELEPDNGKYFVVWRGESEYEQPWLEWFQGNISTKWPDTALYKKMLSIATALNATVQDDEGNLYSEGGDWEFNPPEDDIRGEVGRQASPEIDLESAERSLSLLGILMAVAYIGLPLSLVLIAWLGSPPGETGPYESWILSLTLVSTLALLLCPFLIGLVATRIGKSGTVWGGLSFIFSPVGPLIGYFKIKSAVAEATVVAGRRGHS